eukprot:CAMPEP_0179406572 /NCGR_PEP_ID=MMETSP0799-20121207/971_1 /TAXON_ID=46947 /ORGANISM="Geminigera cryophila, Strain CCMP2564" /LENGTH=234 /DNA_ID=CAMNT_0021177655 /DNA_START=7 /DNA_END=711 /DNA_ORIENTATION=+
MSMGLVRAGHGVAGAITAAGAVFFAASLLAFAQDRPPAEESFALAAAGKGEGQSTQMLKIFRVQVKAPKTCCPAPGGASCACAGGGGGAAAPGASAQMDDGGTQQINMVGFTTKGMGYIQYRGWHHGWDGASPGPVASRAYHDHKVNAKYDYGKSSSALATASRHSQLHHRAHRRGRGRDHRRIDKLKSRLGKDDGEIASLRNEVYQLTSSVLPRIQSEVAGLKTQRQASVHLS